MVVEFPGLGLPPITLDPVLLRVTDSFALNWYGLLIAIAFSLAVTYCLRKCGTFGLERDNVIDMLFFATPSAIICGRLLFVATNWSFYMKNPETIIQTWTGGMSIYGAVIGAVIACSLFCWLRHIHIGAMLDIGAFGLLIGQAVGRWGNFVNVEVYGKETTLPWRMRVFLPNGKAPEVHPLFFYEILWNLLGFFILRALVRKRRYNGQMFTMYVVWYGAGRAFLEGLRDPAYNMMAGKLLISQLIALSSCVIALVLLFVFAFLRKHDSADLLTWQEDYEQHKAYCAERKTARKAGASKALDASSASEEADGSEEPTEVQKPGEEGESGKAQKPGEAE